MKDDTQPTRPEKNKTFRGEGGLRTLSVYVGDDEMFRAFREEAEREHRSMSQHGWYLIQWAMQQRRPA